MRSSNSCTVSKLESRRDKRRRWHSRSDKRLKLLSSPPPLLPESTPAAAGGGGAGLREPHWQT